MKGRIFTHFQLKIIHEERQTELVTTSFKMSASTKIFLSLTIAVVGAGVVSAKCSQEQTDVASDNFKDCMDEKKGALLGLDNGVSDKKEVICDGLEDLSTVCNSAVDSLAGCKGREYVDNLVAIHINSMSGTKQIRIVLL